MPKNAHDTSIRTLWENNPDTPLHASNLSRLQDLTASYLNSDGYPDLSGYENIHVENSILFIDPNNPAQFIMKRGTVIQIINEATDAVGTPVIPKNEQYRVFDVGLEDIIIGPSNTDDTHVNKTSWGNAIQSWYVFLCDKDDGANIKTSSDDYGGGAQILVSKNSDYPLGEVPGRPGHNYSEGDTRLIGGFTTSSAAIIAESLWDVAGKFNTVKARSYHILDEYSGVYRKIAVQDLDTSGDNTFFGNVSVEGNLNAIDVDVLNLTAFNTTFTGVMSQTGDTTIDGELSVTDFAEFQAAEFQQTVVFDSGFSSNNDIYVSDVFYVDTDDREIIVNADAVEITAPVTITGPSSLNGNSEIIGNVSVTGNISSVGVINHNGDLNLNDNVIIADDSITIKSPAGVTDLMTFNQDTATVLLNGDATINGQLILNSGSAGFSLNSTQDINSSSGAGYAWTHLGSFVVDANNATFFKVKSSTSDVFYVQPDVEQITARGNGDWILDTAQTFNITDGANTIFAVEGAVGTQYQKHVVVNSSLEVSDGIAENALSVTGNANITGDLTVEGVLTANIEGNTSGSASSWALPIDLTFQGDVTGTATFDGSQNETVQMQIRPDFLSAYYTQTELQTSGSSQVHWNNISNAPTTFTPSSHIGMHDSEYMPLAANDFWAQLNSYAFVSGATPYTFANANHTHSEYLTVAAGVTAADVVVNSSTDERLSTTLSNIPRLNGSNVFTQSNEFSDGISVAGEVSASGINASGGYVVTTDLTANGKITLQRGNVSRGIHFYDASTPSILFVALDGLLKYQIGATARDVVVSTQASEPVAAKAEQLFGPQTINIVGSGIASSTQVTNKVGDGSGTITLDIDLDYNAIASNHNHDSDYQAKESGFVYGRVWQNTTPVNPKTGDIWTNGTDVKICVDPIFNGWRLLTSSSASPPS